MSAAVLQVACGSPSSRSPCALAHRLKLGLSKEIALAALRATVQLAAVGALIALVFEYEALAIAFVAAMIAHRRADLRRAPEGRRARASTGDRRDRHARRSARRRS